MNGHHHNQIKKMKKQLYAHVVTCGEQFAYVDDKLPLEMPQTLGRHVFRVIRVTKEQGSIGTDTSLAWVTPNSHTILHKNLRSTTLRPAANDRRPHFPVVYEIIRHTWQLIRRSC
jgi:hypothetical protein